MTTTHECCGECCSETEIEDNKIGTCSHCGAELFPCSACVESIKNDNCTFKAEMNGCSRFKHTKNEEFARAEETDYSKYFNKGIDFILIELNKEYLNPSDFKNTLDEWMNQEGE